MLFSKVDRTTLDNGLIVSTVLTFDEGYETAIIDNKGTYPIERYPNEAAAKLGHAKFVKAGELAKSGQVITMLGGLYGLVGPEKITLTF